MKSKPSAEERDTAFVRCVCQVQEQLSQVAGMKHVETSVFALLLIARVPKNRGIPIFKPYLDTGNTNVDGVLVNRRSFNDNGYLVPHGTFWQCVRNLADDTNAYSLVVGLVHTEKLLVFTERPGEYRQYRAWLRERGAQTTVDPWEIIEHQHDFCRFLPANRRN